MKQNKKIISILIILLLFFQQYQQHLLKTPKKLVDEFVKINDKTLTNGNDAFIAIGNESPNLLAIRLLKEKEMKKFFLLIIGQKKWKSLNEILTPFGEKWKSKILSILDKLPQNIDDSLYKSLKQKEITSNFKEFKRQKEILKEKMEGIEKPQKKQNLNINENSQLLLSDFLDEIEEKYKIDLTDPSKLNFTIIEDKFESFSHQFTEIPRFTELKTKIDLSPLQIVKNLGTDEMFVGKKANPDDNLPEPNSSEGGAPCTDSADCIGFQLKIMKCTIIRMIMRMIYELICAIENFFASIVQKICVCQATDQPPYFLKQKEMSCSNRSSWPGIICNLGYQALLALYSICFILWKIIFVFTQMCKVPLGDIIIASPP